MLNGSRVWHVRWSRAHSSTQKTKPCPVPRRRKRIGRDQGLAYRAAKLNGSSRIGLFGTARSIISTRSQGRVIRLHKGSWQEHHEPGETRAEKKNATKDEHTRLDLRGRLGGQVQMRLLFGRNKKYSIDPVRTLWPSAWKLCLLLSEELYTSCNFIRLNLSSNEITNRD